jgi:hypothetical protein
MALPATESIMSIHLPQPIASYFAADAASDADAVARCIAEDAVVRDQEQSHTGRDAIRLWKQSAGTQYAYSVEPIELATDGPKTVVTGRVTGTFPGSPITLRYRFDLAGDHIAALEILP